MNTTSVQLLVRPQDVDEFEFENNEDSARYPTLTLIGTDMHPTDLNALAEQLPFVGFHGSYSGVYRACAVASMGDGAISTFFCDDEGHLSTHIKVLSEKTPRRGITTDEGMIEHLFIDEPALISRGFMASLMQFSSHYDRAIDLMLVSSSRKE